MQRFTLKPLSFRQKLAATLTVTATLAAMAVAPAYAEGSWSSSVTRGNIGAFSSRWWTDNDTDSTYTGVKFSACKGVPVAVNYLSVELFRDNGLFPDASHGVVRNYCNKVYSNWSTNLPSGDFKWRLESVTLISGPTTTGYTVNIPALTTRY
ncbi:MAG: hypothetical protein ACOH1T_08045 [Microbacteriaceae bacterium]